MRKSILLTSLIALLIVACTPTYMVVFSGSQGGSVSTPGGEFDEGSTVSVTAQPDAEYEFERWSDGSTQNPRTITVLEAVNLTAYFVKKQYEFIVNVQGEGTVKQDIVIQGTKLNSGTQVKLTALPATGWYFDSWTGNATGNTNPLTVDIDGAKTITAVFKRQKFDLTVTVVGEGTVTEEVVVQPGQYDYETQVKLTAVPETGWEFTAWSGDLESTENPVTVTVEEAQNITATFTRKKFDLTVTVVGEGTVTEEVVVQPGQYDYETQVKLTAVPETGWEFTAWSGDLESTENPVTVTVEEAQNITATFTRKKFDLTVTVVGEGTVTEEVVVQPGQYDYETQVKLTAVPETGWEFTAWSGDLESTENPVTVTVEEAQNITATFVKKDTDNDGVPDLEDNCPETPPNTVVDGNGCTIPPIKVHSNGVTIVAEDWATVGTEYTLNGKFYKIVDLQTLKTWIEQGFDLSAAVTTKITSFASLFANKNINDDNSLAAWDTSNVTSFYYLFYNTTFNGDISKWDVRKVQNMYAIFANARAFNGDISGWKTENLRDFRFAFSNTIAFNSDLNDWNVSKVTDMNGVFSNADGFNKPLDKWDVSNVTNMANMFFQANIFNQDLSSWCVPNIQVEPNSFAGPALLAGNKPVWGTCPNLNGNSSTGATGGITFSKYSEAKACVNNLCNVSLGLVFGNGSAQALTLDKIEVYINNALSTTYTSGTALGVYQAGESKSFSINLRNASSGKIIAYYTTNGNASTKELIWTN